MFYRLKLICFCILLMPVSSFADVGYLDVVAVVGDMPISNLDLEDRTNLIIRSSGLSDTPEVRQKVKTEALNQLVDEQLHAIEAKKRGITISAGEMEAAISDLEKQNNQAPGSLEQFMASKNVAWPAFTSQLQAQLLWSKMMSTVVRSKVRISEAEFQRAASNQRLVESGQEYNITPLVLSIDAPEKEATLMQLAEKIVQDVKGGAKLESVMQQIMKVPAGKEPRFWVTLDQLEPIIAAQVQTASSGQILGPIRSSRGIHIIRLNETRAKSNVTVLDPSEVTLKEVLLGLRNDASPKEVQLTLGIAKQVSQNPGTCLEPSIAGLDQFDGADISVSFLQSTISELPAYAKQQVLDLDVGEVGEPFATPEGIRFYILCEKVEMPVQVTADEGLRDRLFREKLDLEASKIMRELRRDTFIEIRD